MSEIINTYNIKLNYNLENLDLICQTFQVHNNIWNIISEYIFKNIKKNKLPIFKKVYDANYKRCRRLFKHAPSQIVIRALRHCYSSYQSIKSNKKLGSLKCAPQKRRFSIQLDKRIYNFKSKSSISITTTSGRTLFDFNLYDKVKFLFERYPVSDPSIFIKDNELYISLGFKLPKPIHIENQALGIDLGIKRFATTSEGSVFSDKKYLKNKRRIRYLKRTLNSKKSKSGSARTKLNRIKQKERNMTKDFCHKVSNKILKTDSNTIVLEDLTKIKSKNKGKCFNNKLNQIPFYQFKKIVTYKAERVGKRVVTVNPYNTSKDDYRNIKPGLRKGCRYYTSDGKIFDADWNAAINIAQRYIIHQDLPVSFSEPLDGSLNFIGRASSTAQS